jgi:DNA repair protein RecO (recombination protein O)
MFSKTTAIVLHQIKYGESGMIVTFYTEKFGRLTGMVHGVRSKHSRFPAPYFQPLSLLEIGLNHKQNKELQNIREVACSIPYQSIPFEPLKNTIALFLAEVLYLSLREEENNSTMFSFIFHSLQIFDNLQHSSLFHHWFMFHLTRFLGFSAEEQIIGPLGEPSVFQYMTENGLNGLNQIAQNNSGPPDLPSLSRNERNEILERLIRYYSMHIDAFSRMKSYAVLQEVFSKS